MHDCCKGLAAMTLSRSARWIHVPRLTFALLHPCNVKPNMLNRRQKPPSPKMLALGPVATESIIPVSAYGSRRPLSHRKQDDTARDHRSSTECHNKWELVFYALETLEGMR